MGQLSDEERNRSRKAARRSSRGHSAITNAAPPASPTDAADGQSFGPCMHAGIVSAGERELVRAIRRLEDSSARTIRTAAFVAHLEALAIADMDPIAAAARMTPCARLTAPSSRQVRELAARATFRPIEYRPRRRLARQQLQRDAPGLR